MADWINNDGLRVRFDVNRINQGAPRGEAPGAGETRTIDVIVDVSKATAGTPYFIEGVVIPRNSFIEQAEAVVIETLVGATDLTVGLQHYDGSAYDADGFIEGLTAVTKGSKEVFTLGETGAGALIGETLDYPGTLIVTTTGQGTAGLVSLRVKVLVPHKDLNPGQVNP